MALSLISTLILIILVEAIQQDVPDLRLGTIRLPCGPHEVRDDPSARDLALWCFLHVELPISIFDIDSDHFD